MRFVTDTGFRKKTLQEIREELEIAIRVAFGDGVDFDPSGAFGQLVGLLSKREADLWDGAQEIYASRDPNSASGTALDDLASLTGVVRAEAQKTQAWVYLSGDEGTLVPAGSLMRVNGGMQYALAEASYIGISGKVVKLVLSLSSASEGETYGFTTMGVPVYYTAQNGDTAVQVLQALAGMFYSGISVVGENLVIDDTHENQLEYAAFSNIQNLGIEEVTVLGRVEAVEAGEYQLPAGMLTEIVTPISGWTRVTNPLVGETGRDRESDAELRIRRAEYFGSSTSTEEAIRKQIMNRVAAVQALRVVSNRTNATDADGRPPKSFEVLADGGADKEIAQVIWETQPAGIQSFGNVNANGTTDPGGEGEGIEVVDSFGEPHTVHFSRPTPIYLFVKVEYDLYDEERFPANGEALIKKAIAEWAVGQYDIGKDVIRKRLSVPVYSVSGVGDVVITVDSSANAEHTPSYQSVDIPISVREKAVVRETNIVVEER